VLDTYGRLPTELRMMALGLDPIPKNKGGRPPTLSFMAWIRIAARRDEIVRRLVRRGQSTRPREIAPILKQIGRLRAKNAPPWRIEELSRKGDRIGRYHSIPILRPDEPEPEIDRMTAKEFGVTERMVRTIRSDRRIIELLGPPIWEPRAWEVEERRRYVARKRAEVLMTPERYAKRERVWLASGGLVVEQCSAWAADYDRAVMLVRYIADWGDRPWWLYFRPQLGD
jgi:hypothetical protein